MKEFVYTIKEPVGIHARPAGMLAKEAKARAPLPSWTRTASPLTPPA